MNQWKIVCLPDWIISNILLEVEMYLVKVLFAEALQVFSG